MGGDAQLRPCRARTAAAVLVLFGAAASAGCAGTGTGMERASMAALSTRVVTLEEPGTTAVVTALAFPGSAWELPGTEGLTLMAAETALEAARPGLDALGAGTAVVCDRALFTFTLVAPPDSWQSALDLLLDALFRPDPAPAAMDSARARIRRSLSLDQASPAWQARLAVRQALYGDSNGSSAWAAPPCGVSESLDLYDAALVRAAAYRFARHMLGGLALLGPVDTAAARRYLEPRLHRAVAPGTSTRSPSPAPRVPSPTRMVPGRRYVERNTVTAWVSHAFPFGADADDEALRLLGAILTDELGPRVSRSDVFAASYELERHGSGGALIVHMITAPEAASAHADQLLERVRSVARAGVDAAVLDRASRRHRGERLLEREWPEARAAAVAEAVAHGRSPGHGWPEAGAIESLRVRRAAASLGPAARAVVGPRAARPAAMP